jgi:hydroxyethylthiazole kinase
MREPRPNALNSELSDIAADVFARVRARAPRVHCLTNAVAQTFTANVLLAVGAIPSMTIAPEEIVSFVARADSFLVNLGTFDHERHKATALAIEHVIRKGTPWVLDPVFIDRSQPRTVLAQTLFEQAPTTVRLNSAEFAALTGAEPRRKVLLRQATDHHAVIALTGATDLITDGTRIVEIANGDPLMAKVTAMGDALSALVAACLAVEVDAWVATASAVLGFGVAGEIAAETARGPGSFAVGLIDVLHGLDRAQLLAKGRAT